MSTLKTNLVKNDGSAVDLPNGAFSIGGNSILQGYTESATEPASPSTGDFWWDSTNEVLYQYLNGEFKEIGITQIPPWVVDLSQVSFDNVTFDLSSQDSTPRAFAFNADGTKAYLVGQTTSSVYQYSLSTAWDLSTTSYDSVSFSTPEIPTPMSLSFSEDGTKMFISSYQVGVYSYSLSTAFDITTAAYDNIFLDTDPQETSLRGHHFSSDGLNLFITGSSGDEVNKYTLATAYDVSTASYDSVFSVVGQDGNPMDLFLNPDGTRMYVVGASNSKVYEYSLTTGFDLSSASYSKSFTLPANSQWTHLVFSTTGQKMYTTGFSPASVYQYSTGL